MVDWTTRRPLAFKCFMISLSAAYTHVASAMMKQRHDRPQTGLDGHALIIRDRFDEFPGVIQRAGWHRICSHDTIFPSNAVIVLTKGWCLVDDPCTILVGDVGISDDDERPIFVLQTERAREDLDAPTKRITRTCSVKYSKRGTYRHPFRSTPLNVASFLNLAFFGSLYSVPSNFSHRM